MRASGSSSVPGNSRSKMKTSATVALSMIRSQNPTDCLTPSSPHASIIKFGGRLARATAASLREEVVKGRSGAAIQRLGHLDQLDELGAIAFAVTAAGLPRDLGDLVVAEAADIVAAAQPLAEGGDRHCEARIGRRLAGFLQRRDDQRLFDQ